MALQTDKRGHSQQGWLLLTLAQSLGAVDRGGASVGRGRLQPAIDSAVLRTAAATVALQRASGPNEDITTNGTCYSVATKRGGHKP
jgi:hypothetical protein